MVFLEKCRKEVDKSMGKRIAWLRHRKGLTQEALGKKLGLSASAIGMYEQGRREPSISILISLARELGVTMDYLLTGRVKGAPIVIKPSDSSALKHLKEKVLLCAALLLENFQ